MHGSKTGLVFILSVGFLLAGERSAAEESLADRARAGMRKAGTYWAGNVASHGGYVWEVCTDLKSRRRGESRDLPLSTNWVQHPGTPAVGRAFLKAYEATGDKTYWDAALAAGRCLAWGQLKSGGWAYSIEFDPKRNRFLYHHLDPAEQPEDKPLRNTTTFDDNNTQEATRFLMTLDRHVDDPEISAAVERALRCFLEAQYKDGGWAGAWPQRYPPPAKGYGRYPTFNDNTMSDCARTVLAAYRQYGRPELLDSVRRCLAFYLRAQQPDPQGAWPQQLDDEMKPAWARKFEPPSITGAESRGNCMLLLDMYIEFGDARYLDAVGRAVSWYRRSRIEGTEERGVWARFYELGSNRPLYFTRTYELVYTDDDLPVHYSFKGNYGIDSMMHRYETVRAADRRTLLAKRDRKRTAADWRKEAERLAPRTAKILDGLDPRGRWVETVAKKDQVRDEQGRVGYVVDEKTKLHVLYSRTFIRNLGLLADYLTAVQGGPAVKTGGMP